MKQSSLGLGTSTKRTRRREFLDEMDRVVLWSDLVAQIAPFTPEGKRGRPPFPVESLLRIHFMQQWFFSWAAVSTIASMVPVEQISDHSHEHRLPGDQTTLITPSSPMRCHGRPTTRACSCSCVSAT
jgi:hypothetical protein